MGFGRSVAQLVFSVGWLRPDVCKWQELDTAHRTCKQTLEYASLNTKKNATVMPEPSFWEMKSNNENKSSPTLSDHSKKERFSMSARTS